METSILSRRPLSSTASRRNEAREELRESLQEALDAIQAGQSIEQIECILNDIIIGFYEVRAAENPTADTSLFPLKKAAGL